MQVRRRKLLRWTLRLSLVPLTAALLYILILVYPSPLFAHQETYGNYRVYSDELLPDDMARVVADIDRRIQAMEHAPPAASQRIYLCGQDRYAMYAFLLRLNPESLAMGLSIANETFVSVERVRLFASLNRGVLRHTRFEGNLAEVVAHEVAHFNSVHALGYRRHLALPVWKSEGWAEYQANLAAMRADPDYDLVQRIGLLLDDSYWGGRHGVARSLWESQLVVEYLGEVQGYKLGDLAREDVTLASARAQMLSWHREQLQEAASESERILRIRGNKLDNS